MGACTWVAMLSEQMPGSAASRAGETVGVGRHRDTKIGGADRTMTSGLSMCRTIGRVVPVVSTTAVPGVSASGPATSQPLSPSTSAAVVHVSPSSKDAA